MIETYDMSLNISLEARKDKPNFSEAEREQIKDWLIENYAERLRRMDNIRLAEEGLDCGVIL